MLKVREYCLTISDTDRGMTDPRYINRLCVVRGVCGGGGRYTYQLRVVDGGLFPGHVDVRYFHEKDVVPTTPALAKIAYGLEVKDESR